MISFAENNSFIRHHVFGDYVFTPVRNAFNEKTSWWISKKGYTRASTSSLQIRPKRSTTS